MGLKIKWNDDRLQGTATALLLITRDRLSRGQIENLLQASIDEFRNDPEGYKQNRKTWAPVAETGPLTKPQHIAYYKALSAAVEGLIKKMVQGKRQFNSLTELDNFLVFTLKSVA